MEQRHFLSGHSLGNFNSSLFLQQISKWKHGNIYALLGLLSIAVLIPQQAKAIEITKQLHSPLNHPIGRSLNVKPIREKADRLLRLGKQQYASGFVEKT
ncbi:MAG: hypothetical protein ACKPCP_33055, partial [Sphaerospermopsis kisseleviana]